MSKSELESLEKELRPLLKLVGLIRWLVGLCAACIGFVAGGAVWVANQTNAIAAERENVRAIVDDRKASLKEWTEWRRAKDENDTKFAVLLENQQTFLAAQQRMIERLADRMK